MIKTLFFGTPKFAKTILTHLQTQSELENCLKIVGIVTKLPEKKYDKENNAVYEFAKDLENKNSEIQKQIPIFTPKNLKLEVQEILDKVKPELIIVAAYGKILPKFVLDYPRYKCLNIHASLLPTLRGATPIESAVLLGLKKTGVTLQIMSEKMDEGEIIGQMEYIQNLSKVDSTELREQLANLSCELIDKYLIKYLNGEITPTPQIGEATYCYTSDFTFEKAEIKFDSILQIEQKTRAFSQTGAWVKGVEIIDILSNKKYFLDKLIKLNKASLVDNASVNLNNFDLNSINLHLLCDLKLLISNKKLFLTCTDGFIEVLELTPEGKSKQTSREFINGIWNKMR